MGGLIDAHAHVVLDATMGAAGAACGPELGYHPDGTPWFRVGDWRLDGVRYEGSPFMDIDRRLDEMAVAGISAQLLSPNPLTYLHFIPAPEAIAYCRRHNDELAEIVRAHATKLGAFAALPMQDPVAAVEEIAALGGGSRLARPLHRDRPGPAARRSRSRRRLRCLGRARLPMMLHPQPSGLDGPLRDQRMRRFDLDLVVEFSYEELIAVATVILGGVLRRHPRLDVCVSHAGGSTPMHLAKLEKLAERRAASPEWLREPGVFRSQLANIWFDLHVTGGSERAFAVSQLGTDRLVFGTNFAGWDGGSAAAAGELTDVLNHNAAQLFRLPRRGPRLIA